MTEIERIARALCHAEGFNPDAPCYYHPFEPGPKGNVMPPTGETPVACWLMYKFGVEIVVTMLREGVKPELQAAFDAILEGGVADDLKLEGVEPPTPPEPYDWRDRYNLRTRAK